MTARIIYTTIPFALMAVFFVFITMATPRAGAQTVTATNNAYLTVQSHSSWIGWAQGGRFNLNVGTSVPDAASLYFDYFICINNQLEVDFPTSKSFTNPNTFVLKYNVLGNSNETTITVGNRQTQGSYFRYTGGTCSFTAGTTYEINVFAADGTTPLAIHSMAAMPDPTDTPTPTPTATPTATPTPTPTMLQPMRPTPTPTPTPIPSGFAQDGLPNYALRFQPVDLGNGNIGFLKSTISNLPDAGVPLDTPLVGGIVYNPTTNRMSLYRHQDSQGSRFRQQVRITKGDPADFPITDCAYDGGVNTVNFRKNDPAGRPIVNSHVLYTQTDPVPTNFFELGQVYVIQMTHAGCVVRVDTIFRPAREFLTGFFNIASISGTSALFFSALIFAMFVSAAGIATFKATGSLPFTATVSSFVAIPIILMTPLPLTMIAIIILLTVVLILWGRFVR